MTTSTQRSSAREYCFQFLYQCESERLFHFSEGHFKGFVTHQSLPQELRQRVYELAEGTLEDLPRIDELIQSVATNWSLGRMAATDRNVLRMATYELLEGDTPPKVVLNEAIELAKKYGSNESGSFVNGLLDKVAKQVAKD